MNVNELVDSIDWGLVTDQKRTLTRVLAGGRFLGHLSPEEADAIHEVLGLLTALQEAAASDELGVN
jgi:hypothetical protein